MKHRVAIVHNVVAPYRHPMFEKIFQDPRFDVVVYYCSKGHQSRRWESFPKEYKYKYKFLSGVTIKGLSVNPTIISEIIKKRFGAVIVGGWIDITMQMAFVIGKLLNLPVILWTEGIREPRSFLGLISRPMRTFFIKEADAIIVPGRMSRDYVVSMGADKSKVFIAPNCIDNEFFIEYSSKYKKNKERLKKELKVNKEKVILYVGQLIERKGVDYLIRAYGRLKQEYEEVELIIVGSGPLRNQFKYICNANRISDVHFTESGLKYANLIKYYSIADIFILPTLFDVWGFVINEAMACGLPVVATRASQAAQEMIRSGENGYIVKEADSEELYTILKNLIHNPEHREKMGKKSREIVVHEFDISHMVDGFLSAIKYCTKGM